MNHFVIADNRKCVACFACVAACTEAHKEAGLQAFPRLYVTITPFGAMPMQCRHCEDAMCAMVCPVKAITYETHSIHINETLCIGCKMCALACPYGAIIPGGTPVPGQELMVGHYSFINTPFEPDPMFLRELSYQEQLSLLNWNIGQKTVAVKCDLCGFRQEGPACVIACPHKALSLVTDTIPAGKVELFERMKNVASLAEAVGGE